MTDQTRNWSYPPAQEDPPVSPDAEARAERFAVGISIVTVLIAIAAVSAAMWVSQ